uniref:Uncharacterized protein n=1 Tax=Arundo donax TaxID=35708 RepID=A0A0A8Y7N6_ARUDO
MQQEVIASISMMHLIKSWYRKHPDE